MREYSSTFDDGVRVEVSNTIKILALHARTRVWAFVFECSNRWSRAVIERKSTFWVMVDSIEWMSDEYEWAVLLTLSLSLSLTISRNVDQFSENHLFLKDFDLLTSSPPYFSWRTLKICWIEKLRVFWDNVSDLRRVFERSKNDSCRKKISKTK